VSPTGANSGEHRLLACCSRQLAANGCVPQNDPRKNAFGRLPNAAGWQPAVRQTPVIRRMPAFQSICDKIYYLLL